MRFSLSGFATALSLAAIPTCSLPAFAGVVNPDISALGQLRASVTDAAGSPDRNQPSLGLGESELILTAPLNPYFNGAFTLAAGEGGVEVEEAYTTLVRGLPWGLGLKAGKYRLGFGKLNATHPHVYPFIEPPRSWVSLMPGGEEGFNEAAFQISALLPTPGTWASTVSADVLQGNSFHPDDDRNRVGWLGRWSNAFLLGERGGALEAGVSAATGLDDVGAKARGWLLGADAKARLPVGETGWLTLQGETALRREHPADTTAPSPASRDRSGFFAVADYRPVPRWNGGALYEQWQREDGTSPVDRAARAFVGYAFMEETTLLRVSVERYMPAGESAVHTVSAQLLFSMGPHKAHQF
jgi:hypothetical protein